MCWRPYHPISWHHCNPRDGADLSGDPGPVVTVIWQGRLSTPEMEQRVTTYSQ
jgi:hypothetical protein